MYNGDEGRIYMFSMYRGEEGEDRFVQHVQWKGVKG